MGTKNFLQLTVFLSLIETFGSTTVGFTRCTHNIAQLFQLEFQAII